MSQCPGMLMLTHDSTISVLFCVNFTPNLAARTNNEGGTFQKYKKKTRLHLITRELIKIEQVSRFLSKCLKLTRESVSNLRAIFDGSVGIVLQRYCKTGSVGRRAGLHQAYTHSCGSCPPLIKRTIPCWAIGILGPQPAPPSPPSRRCNLQPAACNTPSAGGVRSVLGRQPWSQKIGPDGTASG